MAITTFGNGGLSITGDDIETYRLLALRGAMSLELVGLKSRVNPFKIAREMHPELPRNKLLCYLAFCKGYNFPQLKWPKMPDVIPTEAEALS
jgi:hypothetical protein